MYGYIAGYAAAHWDVLGHESRQITDSIGAFFHVGFIVKGGPESMES